MIYLDNAATSFPKNEVALRRAMEIYFALGASPGRGGYDRAVEAEEMVSAVRREVAKFFNAPAGSQVCFAANATDALNTLIQGLYGSATHIISTSLEHNSVLRPLRHMERLGLQVDLIGFDEAGYINPQEIRLKLRPETKAVIVNHASNVLGTVQPVAEVGDMLRDHGAALCVDASQTAGLIPLDMQKDNISAVAFTGHKSLRGPTGIGALVFGPDFELAPSRFGGTGVDSSNPYQPDEYPMRLESGTQNMLGILALGECLCDLGVPKMKMILDNEMHLFKQLYEALSSLSGVTVYGGHDLRRQVPLLSCSVKGMTAADVGAVLDGDFDIAVRTGLHCAPLVHKGLGTAPLGTVRFSLGPQTTKENITAAIHAMEQIAFLAG
ncbi:aminotransferase class V-fold PLP-dependent enzyme [Maridesulfovibrio sp.]|uniref:aminotransferase class V-fold PLP-dependent enzyme n=1 Tax=Maridesulfovibrio sp. TaxID=2795000 RepID=UPI0029F5B6AB|nr:aminotransferase class V-fold PLP-dependent enzyme [Maridesulfovibrio sp.]